MGVSNSRLEEDEGVQLCRARKKFIKQALNGRCSLAAAHIAYIEELRNLGVALRRFVESEAQNEPFVNASRNPISEIQSIAAERPVSQLSISSRPLSRHASTAANISPSPSTPVSREYQSHHMKFRGAASEKVEEKPPEPVAVSISSTPPLSNTPRSTEVPEASSFESPSMPPETPPWDYFGLFHPVDDHLSTEEDRAFDLGSEKSGETPNLTTEEGAPQMEDVEENLSSRGIEETHISDDEFDEPSSASLVRSFENLNRAKENIANSATPLASSESKASKTKFSNTNKEKKVKETPLNGHSPVRMSEDLTPDSKFVNEEQKKSPNLSPLRATSSRYTHFNDVGITPLEFEQSEVEDKVAPKDFISSMKDIEHLFGKASESGKEVPRMLEANKFHFRPVIPGRERGSLPSSLLKSCFSCGEDPSEVPQEPPQDSVKYLTWHRTTSSRSASSRNLLGSNSSDVAEDLSRNLFDNFCMVSGSHASTLDRLWAWEKKLYDEVKAGQILRSHFDQKCRLLRQQESRGEHTDKTRAIVKDLHSRIKVAIHRIDSISKRIEDIRDKELQPQLEELIEGLRKMWEMMLDCHKLQFHILSICHTPGNMKIVIQTDMQKQITIHLEHRLSSLSSTFTKWIGAQKIYVECIDKWILKCVTHTQNTSKKKRSARAQPIRNTGPPIYMLCYSWIEMIYTLPLKGVTDSIKDLSVEVAHFLPHQEKNQAGKKDGDPGIIAMANEDRMPELDSFRTSLAGFLGQMNNFAECSMRMFSDLQKAIQEAKLKYEQFKSQEPYTPQDFVNVANNINV